MHLPTHNDSTAEIAELEWEIAQLEGELLATEEEINVFGAKLRAALAPEIARLEELSALYKAQKNAKKAKRQAQKMRGKNYQEPKGIKKTSSPSSPTPPSQDQDQDELRKLYREAIVQVHPDKFASAEPDLTEKAHSLAARLNSLYDAGDLEGLRDFHIHILSGNALSHTPFEPQTVANPAALKVHLEKQRDRLRALLAETMENHLYHVLKTYPFPIDFLGELQIYFRDRIAVMEKRTRVHKQRGPM